MVYPAIDTGFELPEYTHTDKTVTISTAAELESLDIIWSVSKNGETVQFDSVLEGSLSNEGGTIAFKEKGSYVIAATFTDDAGRTFTHSETVIVYPIVGVAFDLPDMVHTDTSIDLITTLTEMDGLSIEWSLNINGETVPISDASDGKLTDTGGSIRFKEKGYTF